MLKLLRIFISNSFANLKHNVPANIIFLLILLITNTFVVSTNFYALFLGICSLLVYIFPNNLPKFMLICPVSKSDRYKYILLCIFAKIITFNLVNIIIIYISYKYFNCKEIHILMFKIIYFFIFSLFITTSFETIVRSKKSDDGYFTSKLSRLSIYNDIKYQILFFISIILNVAAIIFLPMENFNNANGIYLNAIVIIALIINFLLYCKYGFKSFLDACTDSELSLYDKLDL